MNITDFLLLIAFGALFVTLYLFYKYKTYSSKIFFTLNLISVFLVAGLSSLWILKFINPANAYYLVTLFSYKDLISPTITTLGLIVTISIAYITTTFNQKKQEIDLILSMISDQKQLIDDHVLSTITEIQKRCQEELHPTNLAYLRFENRLKSQMGDLLEKKDHYFTEVLVQQELEKLLNKKNLHNHETISDRDIELLALHGFSSIKMKNNSYKINFKDIAPASRDKILGKKNNYPNLSKFLVTDQVIKSCLFPKESFFDPIKYEEVFPVVNNIYRVNYYKLGHLFKHFHRIIRLILQGRVAHDHNLQKDLIGILRAQYSEELLQLIYYNATYTSRGLGLGMLLQGTCFWGDRSDFEVTGDNEITHISTASLYFKQKDKKIMEELYAGNSFETIKSGKGKEEAKKNFMDSIRKNFDAG